MQINKSKECQINHINQVNKKSVFIGKKSRLRQVCFFYFKNAL